MEILNWYEDSLSPREADEKKLMEITLEVMKEKASENRHKGLLSKIGYRKARERLMEELVELDNDLEPHIKDIDNAIREVGDCHLFLSAIHADLIRIREERNNESRQFRSENKD